MERRRLRRKQHKTPRDHLTLQSSHFTHRTHTHNLKLLSDKTHKKKKRGKSDARATNARGETFSYHIAAVIIHLIVQGLSCPKKHLNSSSTACNITSCWLSCRSFTNSFPLSPSPTSIRLCAMTYSRSKTSISNRANKKLSQKPLAMSPLQLASSCMHTDFRKNTDPP